MERPTPAVRPPPAARTHEPQPPAGARCLTCDYLLDGLTTPVCPECGRPFDPTDPATFLPQWFRTRLLYRLSRRWASPPPLWQLAGYALVLCAGIWPPMIASDEARHQYFFLAALAAPLACSWFMRKWAVSCWGDRRETGPRMSRLKWSAGPFAVAWLCAGLFLGPWLSPDFIISYPFLHGKAHVVLAGRTAENRGQMVGLLWTRRIAPVGQGVKFQSWRGHVLVYDPTGDECRSSHVVCSFGDWCWREY